MEVNEDRLTAGGTETLAEAKRIAKDNAARMARIILLPYWAKDYHVTEVGTGGRIRKYNDDKELARLTALFFHTIKPSKLVGAFRSHNQRKQRGFYKLYAITERRKDDPTEDGAHRVTRLNSPYGRRGSICAHLGWTWDYLHHGVAWAIVQRLLIDAPSIADDEDGSTDTKATKITSENAESILQQINNLIR